MVWKGADLGFGGGGGWRGTGRVCPPKSVTGIKEVNNLEENKNVKSVNERKTDKHSVENENKYTVIFFERRRRRKKKKLFKWV